MTQISAQILPINDRQKSEVVELTTHFIDTAEHLFLTPLPKIPVLFDLKGQSAGMFRVKKGVQEIRFNPWIFALDYDQNSYDTVPHEVAHYVVNVLFGRRNIKPHGREWQNVMIAFGREPKTTCNYDLERVPLRCLKHYAYRCHCQDHKVSSIRHNRILKGQTYCCKKCRSRLEPITLSS